MLELDKRLFKVTRVINRCYETLYPHFPKYPQFSFTRAMITMWKTYVYEKLEKLLLDRFAAMLHEVRDKQLGVIGAESESEAKEMELETSPKMIVSDGEQGMEYKKEQAMNRY